MFADDLPPGYSASDVVGSDLPPGYKASDVVAPSAKKPAPVDNRSGGQIYGESVSKASPYQPTAPKPKPYNPVQNGRPFSLGGGRGSEEQEQPETMQVGPLKKTFSRSGMTSTIPGKLKPGTDIETRIANMPLSPKKVALQSFLGAAKVGGFGEPPTPEKVAMMIAGPLLGAAGPVIGTATGEAMMWPQIQEAVEKRDIPSLLTALTIGGIPGVAHGTAKGIETVGRALKKPPAPQSAEILNNFQQTPYDVSDVPALTRLRLPGTTGPQAKLLPPAPDNAFVVDPQGNAQRANIGNLQNPDVLGRPNAIEKPPAPANPYRKPSSMPAPATTATAAIPTEGQAPPRTQGEAALGNTHPNARETLEVHPLTGENLKTKAQMQDAADSMNAMFPGSNAAVETIGRRNTLTIDSGWEKKGAGGQKPSIPQPPAAPPSAPTPKATAEAPQTTGETPPGKEPEYDTLEDVERKRAGNIREKIQKRLNEELPYAAMPKEHQDIINAENEGGFETAERVNKINKAAIILGRSGSTWADKIKARRVMNEMTGIDPSINSPRFGRMKGESEGSFAHRIRRDFSDNEWGLFTDKINNMIDQAKGGGNAVPEQKPSASVPGQEGPQMELPGVGEGDPKPESPPEQKGFTIKKSNPRQGSFDASIGEDVARAVQHGAELIGKKIVTFAKWSGEMVKEFGDTIRPHLVNLWYQSHDAFKAGATQKKDEPIPPDIQSRIERLNAQTGKPEQKPTAGENIGNAIKGAWMAPSAWQTIATPFHAVLRHGLPLTLNHPGMAAESIGQTWKAFASKEGFAQVREFIDNLPTKQMADHYGVADTGQHIADPTKGEEEMIGNAFLQKIPGGGSIVGGLKNAMNANHRGFVTYLDLMAQKGFAKKAAQLEEWGITPAKDEAAYKGLAGLINNQRGRGSLGPLENQAALAAAVMYAPRLQVSRIALMNPVYYAKMEPGVRRIAITDAAKGIGVAVSAIMAAKAAGAEVPTDPRDSNFLKMKFGNRWVDPLGGFRSYIPLVAQSVSGQKVVGGQLKNNVGFGESRGTVAAKLAMQEVRKKFSPSMGMAYNLSPLSKDKDSINRNAVGDMSTPVSEAENVGTPFFGRDLLDYFKHNDIGSTIAGEIASQLGASSYEPSVRAPSFKSKGLGGANMKSLLKSGG